MQQTVIAKQRGTDTGKSCFNIGHRHMASSARCLDFFLQRRVSLYLAGNLRSPKWIAGTIGHHGGLPVNYDGNVVAARIP